MNPEEEENEEDKEEEEGQCRRARKDPAASTTKAPTHAHVSAAPSNISVQLSAEIRNAASEVGVFIIQIRGDLRAEIHLTFFSPKTARNSPCKGSIKWVPYGRAVRRGILFKGDQGAIFVAKNVN